MFAYLFRGTRITREIQHPDLRRQARESFSLRLVRQVPLSLFFFLGAIASVWGVVFPFEVVGVDMLEKDFGYSADYAGIIISIAPSISICSPLIAPFLGTTLNNKLLSCSVGLIILALAFIVLSVAHPIPGVLILGVGYAISVCSFYSTLPMFVKAQVPKSHAKSVEILLVGLNMVGSGISMIMSNLIIGMIKDGGSYKGANIYLCCLSTCGLGSLCLAVKLRTTVPEDQNEDSGEMAEQVYAVGESVQMRDHGNQWQQGVVTSLEPFLVRPFGDDAHEGRSWDEVRHEQSEDSEYPHAISFTGDYNINDNYCAS